MKLILALLLLLPAAASAQVIVELQPQPLEAPVGFTVEQVLDARPDTTTIGTAQTGLLNTQRSVHLAGGTVPAVLRYLRGSLPADSAAVPLAVRIEALEVAEATRALKEFARAEVRLRFFRIREDGQLGDLGAAEARVERQALDVTHLHDDNLRDALNEAIRLFAASDWRDATPSFAPAEVLASAAVPAPTAAAPAPSPARPLRSAFAVSPLLGQRGRGAGLAYIQYLDFEDWLVPVSFSLNVVSAENPDEQVEGLFMNAGPTVGVIRRLGRSPVALALDLQLPIGTETVDYGDEQRKRMFAGARLSQSFLHLPQAGGPIVGVGFYASRLFGSTLYPHDLGVQLTLGFQR